MKSDKDAKSTLDPSLPAELVRFRTFASPFAKEPDEPEVFDHLQGRLRFKDITTFNDPFEARPQYKAAYSNAAKQRDAMVKYLTDIAPITGSKTARRQWAESQVTGQSQEKLVERLAAYAESRDKAGQMFVFCMMAPEAVTSPMPWSLYGDSHRGVCIHFDANQLPIGLAFPVEYSDEYPTVLIPRTAQDNWVGVRNVLLRKASSWSFEKEYRVFRVLFADGTARDLFRRWDGNAAIADPKICTGVTLGYRMKPEVREHLMSWIRGNAPHVQVWQAKLHRSKYMLERERIA
jgi:hypothetical protein